MKSALETGDLDQVNKVLGKMKVDEAEELVALFAEVSLFRADLSDTTPPARTRTNHWHRQISSALRSKSLTLRQRKGRNSGRSWRRQPRRTLKLKKDRWEIRNR
jgi:hypothetical protein